MRIIGLTLKIVVILILVPIVTIFNFFGNLWKLAFRPSDYKK